MSLNIKTMVHTYDLEKFNNHERLVVTCYIETLPLCRVVIDPDSKDFRFQRLSHACSDLRVVDEVRNVLAFLDDPHWRNTVSCSICESDYDLFNALH